MPTTCAGCRIDRELAPDRRFVGAESPLPKRVRENDRRRPVGSELMLRFREPTPAQRLHAERLKRAVGDESARTRSGSPRSVSVAESSRHTPMSANVPFSFR